MDCLTAWILETCLDGNTYARGARKIGAIPGG